MTGQNGSGVYRSVRLDRRTQRRKQLGVALAGLAVFGAAGAFVAQIQVFDLTRRTTAQEPRSLAPPVTPSPSSSSPSSTVSPSTRSRKATPEPVNRSGARQRTSPTPTPTPTPSLSLSVPASVAASSAGLSAAAERKVQNRSETTAGGTIRVTTAGFDLSGRPELDIAGDRGWAVGRARCTHSIRSDSGRQVRAAPGMLVCWRTSPARSVVTVAVSARGRAQSGESIAVLEREWTRLG